LAMLPWRSQEQAIWVAATVTTRDMANLATLEGWLEYVRNLFDVYP